MSMNLIAYEENERNKKHCTYYPSTGHLLVDGHRARYRGVLVCDLSNKQRRKFETLLLLQHADRRNAKPLKVVFQ